jgi:two-component sensor histidine kinase
MNGTRWESGPKLVTLSEIHACLPGAVGSVPRARHLVAEFKDRLEPRLYEDARLLVTEAMSNAFRHGQPNALLRLTVKLIENGLYVHVVNSRGKLYPRMPETPSPSGGGLGLRLIDTLADEWQTGYTDDIVVIWFTLRAASD